MELAFMGDGETKVELICSKNAPATIIGNGVSIGFEVKSAAAKLESLKGVGVPVVSEIIQPNPHTPAR